MLQVKNIDFSYHTSPVLQNISFQVNKGEHVSLIGASGCGKSTLLQLIYGLHHTDGRIYWNDIELLGPNYNLVPGEDFIKYLAQDFDLMPPLSVADNVGKYLSNMYPKKKKQRILELLEVVEMHDLAGVKAKNLSGGQQQRVALARALAKEPELLLLDEPFSHIDHFRKNNLRRRVYKYLKEQNITCITATHDSTDALSFADQSIILKNGKIHAQGKPKDIYNMPPNKYVASLFGDINEIPLNKLIEGEKSKKRILLYPHEIKAVENSEISVNVLQSFFKGKDYLIKADLKGTEILFEHKTDLKKSETVFLEIPKQLILSRLKKR